MTTLTAANLPTFSFDQLGTAYTIANRRALDADPHSGARTRALGLRGRVEAEVARRGATITKLSNGTYAVYYRPAAQS